MGEDSLVLEGLFVYADDVGETAEEGEGSGWEVEVWLEGLELLELPGLAEVGDEEVRLGYGGESAV